MGEGKGERRGSEKCSKSFMFIVFYDSCLTPICGVCHSVPLPNSQNTETQQLEHQQQHPIHTVNSPTNLKSRELAPTLTINLPAGTTHSCLATSQ